jgi:hypothetical protein
MADFGGIDSQQAIKSWVVSEGEGPVSSHRQDMHTD